MSTNNQIVDKMRTQLVRSNARRVYFGTFSNLASSLATLEYQSDEKKTNWYTTVARFQIPDIFPVYVYLKGQVS